MPEARERIEVRTHGRYLVAAPENAAPRGILVGCHGYAEQASIQMDRLQAIRGALRLAAGLGPGAPSLLPSAVAGSDRELDDPGRSRAGSLRQQRVRVGRGGRGRARVAGRQRPWCSRDFPRAWPWPSARRVSPRRRWPPLWRSVATCRRSSLARRSPAFRRCCSAAAITTNGIRRSNSRPTKVRLRDAGVDLTVFGFAAAHLWTTVFSDAVGSFLNRFHEPAF